jgi:hypothetical protein
MIRFNKIVSCVILALACIVLISYTEIKPNEISFKVYRGKNHIGKLTSAESIENGKTTYTLNYDVKIDVLLSIKIIENMTSVFQDKKMLTSVQTRFINGTAKVKNTAYWKDGMYTMKNKDDELTYIKSNIYANICNLYSKEPLNIAEVYSESYQQLIPLKKIEPNKYSIELPDGNTSIYSYKNGLLQEVVSNTNWGNLRFIRD